MDKQGLFMLDLRRVIYLFFNCCFCIFFRFRIIVFLFLSRKSWICGYILLLQFFSQYIWYLCILFFIFYSEFVDSIQVVRDRVGLGQVVYLFLGFFGRRGVVGRRVGRRIAEGLVWRGSYSGGVSRCFDRFCLLFRFFFDQ